MKHTKELVSGRDIDLTKHYLGIIKQPKVDDFMGEMDLVNFVKPFYLERSWRVNGLFKDEDIPFTLYVAYSTQQPELLDELMSCLNMLYVTGKVSLEIFDDNEIKVVVKDDEGKMTACIDDSNFDILCQTVVLICNYPEPKKQEKEKIDGDAETLALFEKYEKEYQERHKDKDVIEFEEIVREVIHTRMCSYEDVKNLTVWQLQDAYKTYMLIENERFEKALASSGCYKVDKIKRWQDQTKIIRDKNDK